MSAILFRKNIYVFSLLCMMLMCLAGTVEGLAQDAKFQSQVTPPPVTPVGVNQKKSPKDSVELRQPVADKVSDNYGNLQFVQQPTVSASIRKMPAPGNSSRSSSTPLIRTHSGDPSGPQLRFRSQNM